MQQSLFDLPTVSYHNSVPISGNELKQANDNAINQDAEILELFKRLKSATPWQIEARLNANGKKWPITSVRRSITNLTNQMKLRKAGKKIIGPLGSKENVWEII
jgi:hypothetical protein